MRSVVFFDAEIAVESKKIQDLGAIRSDGAVFHAASVSKFEAFIAGAEFVCGHNIIHHDLKYIQPLLQSKVSCPAIDTLYLSPLLFPQRPYHALLKDDKLQVDELNNPVNDSEKAKTLFYDEISAFYDLSSNMKQILCCLLYSKEEFHGFFSYVNFKSFSSNLEKLIREEFADKFCSNANIAALISHYPVELAYALSIIRVADRHSMTPPWLLRNFPKIENVMKFLCNTPCTEICNYCSDRLDIHKGLKRIFGYDEFRSYNGEPLQEMAARAAVDGGCVLAVFPTGGGKSITFQLPALMAGEALNGLTVVISPLQSLMKDQVDNLAANGIESAVTINGMLDPIERADAFERVASGMATLLYISPEQLRSRTIEKLLLSRTVVRFVIDEAHCFSAWGHDFRVDYLYIGDFIRELQTKKKDKKPIPVSCFTATAKQKVITDICDYFDQKLGLRLQLFSSSATRENLRYAVLYQETDEEKYVTLRNLIAQKNCPTIVYVSRTKRTKLLAEKLTSDGFPARAFNGKMDSRDKIANQESFIQNEFSVIIATSAFGMGVDKKDVKLVIHYDISDSLENYVQEAGRAGRDPNMDAECYVLYTDSDLDKHFILLNQTKLSIGEIQQVWKAIKDLTRFRPNVCCSPLEIARQAGWGDNAPDIETRVKTAIAALENAGYVKRGRNVPHVYATSILARNMNEASHIIEKSVLFSDKQRQHAKRIISSLISSRSISKPGNDDAESRIDYLADTLSLTKEEVVTSVNLMRQDGLLSDSQDMSAYILKNDTVNKSTLIVNRFAKLEEFILSQIGEDGCYINLKDLNEAALNFGIGTSNVRDIRTIFYYLTIKNYIHKNENGETQLVNITPSMEQSNIIDKFRLRIDICRFLLSEFYTNAAELPVNDKSEIPIEFSLVGMFQAYQQTPKLIGNRGTASLKDIEDSLLYLSKINALKIEGGFLVLYNAMELKRIVLDNKRQYRQDDYRLLDEFYKQKIRQIHIVGEYANLMVRDYSAALQFVQDYFHLEFKKFISKYFKGERAKEIDRNITPAKYRKLFDELSTVQKEIINDAESKYIVVAAGPGSGKTRILVHKIAALLLLEDVKHEQLLMLTFSRAAATEFKKRLIELIGNAANFVEIKTFHSYCFDLLGKNGNLDDVENVVKDAAIKINGGEIEPEKIVKRVLVIDEAQDMDKHEFSLVAALMKNNEEMRVIAVGDDDQNIYEFRGSDSKYLRDLVDKYGAKKYELNDNYRSKPNIVALGNMFISAASNRMKQTPIKAVQKEDGTVKIIRYSSHNMEAPLVQQICDSYNGGTSCVLTNTNEKAFQITALLSKKGVNAKLIQSTDGFRLYNLAEVRFFLKCIDANLNSPVISVQKWEYAKQRLLSYYSDSSCLENMQNLISDFETTYPIKYRSDLEEFIKESSYDDFYTDDREIVYVSTIHKAKGREFDQVYMLIDNMHTLKEDQLRRLYVGITRARAGLYIHSNTDLFSKCSVGNIETLKDNNPYPQLSDISLQLTHRDLFLDYFKGKKETVLALQGGARLFMTDEFFSAQINGRTVRVAKCSKSFHKKIENYLMQGYHITGAKVRFVVAWKGEDDEDETAVMLPDVYLSK